MSVYDADVIQQLGKEAYNYFLDRVKCGVINAQHMNDISRQLHPHVLGDHLIRIGSGTKCDEAEFRRILGDWFNQEMFDLDQQTALTRLASILSVSTFGRKEVGSDLGDDQGEREIIESHCLVGRVRGRQVFHRQLPSCFRLRQWI